MLCRGVVEYEAVASVAAMRTKRTKRQSSLLIGKLDKTLVRDEILFTAASRQLSWKRYPAF